MSKETDKAMMSIITFSNNMYTVYEALARATAEGNDKEIKKQLEYIALIKEFETKEYENFNISSETIEILYNRFSYLLSYSSVEESIQELIYSRFKNHINEIFMANPFLSQCFFASDKKIENKDAILHQAERDFIISSLFFLNEKIQKEKNIAIRQEIIEDYYDLLFTRSKLDQFLKTPPQEVEQSGRKRCLALKQEKENVNSYYFEFIRECLTTSVTEIVQYTDEYREKYPDCLGTQKANIALLKSAISMLTTEEKEKLNILPNKKAQYLSRKSCKDIEDAIVETNLYMAEIAPQKKKVPSR